MIAKTILLIASDKKLGINVTKFLEQKNFSIITANNDRLGLELVYQKSPDLIICQLASSEIDGYGVLTKLRQNDRTFTTPFIFITTKFNNKQWRRAINLGADDFLVQPLSASELQKVVINLLTKQEVLVTKYRQELEHLRSSILGFLPHEMRTALTGILASSDLLINQLDSLDLSIVRELLYCIDSSSKRLSRLVHNFLLYSELNLIIQNPEQVELLCLEQTTLCQDIVDPILDKLSKIHNRQANIIWAVGNVTLAIKTAHLAKVIEELIDNACKFSSANKPITVTGYVEGDYLILSVSDRGRGMATQQISLIGACIQFERSLYEQQGLGLGLAIVKQLMKIYRGRLAIDSILNQETNVTVYLPLVKPRFPVVTESQQNAAGQSRVLSASML